MNYRIRLMRDGPAEDPFIVIWLLDAEAIRKALNLQFYIQNRVGYYLDYPNYEVPTVKLTPHQAEERLHEFTGWERPLEKYVHREHSLPLMQEVHEIRSRGSLITVPRHVARHREEPDAFIPWPGVLSDSQLQSLHQ